MFFSLIVYRQMRLVRFKRIRDNLFVHLKSLERKCCLSNVSYAIFSSPEPKAHKVTL